MTLVRKVRQVEEIFTEIDEKIFEFQIRSGLHCIPGCSHCCLNAELEATVLEFLPLAYHFYKKGSASALLEKLLSGNRRICHILSPVPTAGASGFCSEYAHRGLVCRLFGFSARQNKSGTRQMYTCRLIKENHRDLYLQASLDINRTLSIPMVRDYYFRLMSIDPDLGNEYHPVNTAIRKAIESVLSYYSYRKDKRSPGKPAQVN